MEMFLLYLFTRLDGLQVVSVLMMSGGGVASLICFVMADTVVADDQEQKERVQKCLRRCFMAFCIGFLGSLFVPSQKDAALILAGTAIIDVAKTETAGRLASKSVQLIEQTLDSYLKEKK